MYDVDRLRREVKEFLWVIDPIGVQDIRPLVWGEYNPYVDSVVSDLVNRGPEEAAERLSARFDAAMGIYVAPSRLLPGLSAIDTSSARD